MPIKSFRGLIPPDSMDTITLHTNNGKTGYKIHKLQIIQMTPGGLDIEGMVKIWKVEPNTAEITSSLFDLSDNRILGIGFYSSEDTANLYPEDMTIIFENEIFNQDIYISNHDVGGQNDSMNYYLELETIPLALDEATVATLKDIRNSGPNKLFP